MGALLREFPIPCSKIFPEIEKYNPQFKNVPYKNVSNKEGGIHTKFTIPSSKIFSEIQKYNSKFKNISFKKCCKKRGGISYRIHHSQLLNISRGKYKSSCKNISYKNVGKKEGLCLTQSTVILQNFRMQGIEKYNTNNRILRYIKCFPFLQKMLEKKRGYLVQNSLLSQKISACGDRKWSSGKEVSKWTNLQFRWWGRG